MEKPNTARGELRQIGHGPSREDDSLSTMTTANMDLAKASSLSSSVQDALKMAPSSLLFLFFHPPLATEEPPEPEPVDE